MTFVLFAAQPIEALKGIDKSLKVQLRGTFNDLSGVCKSAKCCKSLEAFTALCTFVVGMIRVPYIYLKNGA